MKYPNRDIVVIGGSAGGVVALTELLSHLDADLPAAVFVTLHVHEATSARLASVVGEKTDLPVAFAADEQPIEPARVTLAPPGFHLLLLDDRIRLIAGPRENLSRPAIDPMFRSAAVAYGPRVIGMVLSGMLDDGAAGLLAVRRCGGEALVQSSETAERPDMPEAAAAAADPVFVGSPSELAARIGELTHGPAGDSPPVPDDLLAELDFNRRALADLSRMDRFGRPAPMGCPACGGPLWVQENRGEERYRCHIGHAYSSLSLLEDQDRALEKSLWVALRTLEERSRLLGRLAERRVHSATGGQIAARARESQAGAESIRQVLEDLGSRTTPPTQGASRIKATDTQRKAPGA